ncbi:hypothetical protein Pcinc_021001 [Petrolisthes cinctipes]|uniref:Uncharacterized protein n=1 Tax=Petrolisthes cinctipes TaxID=88211 RepID=A0AAE1KJ22_PETCI|nr:hypothetical protein Pcinc_021001 [Petrolisthes cinctipes]
MGNEECIKCSETHPCPRHSLCCIRGSRSKKEKGERYMTYDPLRCMICKAFIAESENGVAAAQAELRKHFIAIRGHRQHSRCPIPELMNFFSSEEEANRLLNLAHYIPPSPRAHSRTDPLSQLTLRSHSEASLQLHRIEANHSLQQTSPTALPSTLLQGPSREADTITMEDSEPATQADVLSQAVAFIPPHLAPEPLVVHQSSTPRGDGSLPRKRPCSHSPGGADTIIMEDSERATQAVTSILQHPAPKLLVVKQSSTPRGG